MLNGKGRVYFVGLLELVGKELGVEWDQAENHEDDLGNEVDWLFTVVLNAELCPQDGLSHVEFVDLDLPLLFWIVRDVRVLVEWRGRLKNVLMCWVWDLLGLLLF